MPDSVARADIIITTTSATRRLVVDQWLQRGCHITAVGSDAPHKQELDVAVVAKAVVVAVDSLALASEVGEVRRAASAGLMDWDRAVQIGDLLSGSSTGRARDAERTIADLAGTGIQDAALADVVVARTGGLGLGRTVELETG